MDEVISNMLVGFDRRGQPVTVTLFCSTPLTRPILRNLQERLGEMMEPLPEDALTDTDEANPAPAAREGEGGQDG